jgi:hypothetical protein
MFFDSLNDKEKHVRNEAVNGNGKECVWDP